MTLDMNFFLVTFFLVAFFSSDFCSSQLAQTDRQKTTHKSPLCMGPSTGGLKNNPKVLLLLYESGVWETYGCFPREILQILIGERLLWVQ